MVKPQLNLDKKDDLKKPDGNLVKVVTIGEEPAPMNPEPVYYASTPRSGRACRCLCLFLLLVFFLILTFMGVGLIFHLTGRSYGWCGVGYYDDWDYAMDDELWNSELSSSYYAFGDKLPYGDDMFPVRPTGPPLQRFLEEGLDIDLKLRTIRINSLGDEYFPSVNVLHDFNQNMSAYQTASVCYIRSLNMDTTLVPEEFQNLVETEAYKDQDFQMQSEVYSVNPANMVDLDQYGEHISELCGSFTSYYIQSIPSEQWPTFWRTVRQVLRDHLGRRRGSDSDSDEAGRGRHHGRRPNGRRGGHHESSSSEEEHRRQRRLARVKDYVDNIRSFNGQQVVDMHVFQMHNLDDLSPQNIDKLTNLINNPPVDEIPYGDDIVRDQIPFDDDAL